MAEGVLTIAKPNSGMQDTSSGDETKPLFKIVFLGETGAGKTSLIKFILNYARRHYGKPFQLEHVSAMSEVEKFGELSGIMKMGSKTVNCTKYIAKFGEFRVGLIDTPGFNDTRSEHREINTAKIIKAVKEEEYINCVCLVVNGTQSRLTKESEDVFKEVTSVLPRSILTQVVVVCTKTHRRANLDFSLSVLHEFGLTVPKQCFFYLDNPHAQWEKVMLKPLNNPVDEDEYISDDDNSATGENIEAELKRSFDLGHKKIDKIIDAVRHFQPTRTTSFGELYELVQDIEATIAEISIEYLNNKRVGHKIEELKEYLAANEPFSNRKLHFYTKIIVKTSKRKNMICHVPDCHSNCHLNCDCWFTFITNRACLIMDEGVCSECSHPVSEHRLCTYYYDTVEAELPIREIPGFEKVSESVKGKKNLLDIQESYKSASEKVIDELTETLKAKLIKLQGIGSNCHFRKTAIDKIENLRMQVNRIDNYKHEIDINHILNETLLLIQDPLTATDENSKYRWACGYLEINPDYPDTETVSKAFERQATLCHPDIVGAQEGEPHRMLVLLNHAKDCIIGGAKVSLSFWPSSNK